MFPILFKTGPVTLHTYGVLVAIGFIVGITVTVRLGKRAGIAREKILDIGFYTLIAAIVGSRLFFVLSEYEYYLENPFEIFKIWEGGLAFFGGLLLAIPVLILYVKKNALPPWRILDLFAPGLAIGHAIGRIGCFSAGCCYGKPTALPWGVTFNNPDSLAVTGISLHPVQLYESAVELGIFTFLLLLRKHKSFDGQIMWTYVLLYSIARFFIEFFRGDKARGLLYSDFSIAQGVSALLFVAAFFFLFSQRKNKH